MKFCFKKSVCVTLAAVFAAMLFASCGVDTSVKQDEESSKDYVVSVTDEKEDKERTHTARSVYGPDDTHPSDHQQRQGGVHDNLGDRHVCHLHLSHRRGIPR